MQEGHERNQQLSTLRRQRTADRKCQTTSAYHPPMKWNTCFKTGEDRFPWKHGRFKKRWPFALVQKLQNHTVLVNLGQACIRRPFHQKFNPSGLCKWKWTATLYRYMILRPCFLADTRRLRRETRPTRSSLIKVDSATGFTTHSGSILYCCKAVSTMWANKCKTGFKANRHRLCL